MSNIIFTNDYSADIFKTIEGLNPSGCMVYIDENVNLTPSAKRLEKFPKIIGKHGEHGKTLENVYNIWTILSDRQASRNTLLICVGGGSATDAGGFAAATFKRGIPTINVPTTLLAMVDASVGGKTAIDFNGLKNEIGAFHTPLKVIIDVSWLKTLPHQEILSGYGEILKTALIHSEDFFLKILANGDELIRKPEKFEEYLPQIVATKEKIVEEDPYDRGVRHILNFGHTAGHAFEALSLRRNSPVPHGIAVAQGMMTEMILANMKLGFNSTIMTLYAKHFKDIFPLWKFGCNDYNELLELMRHDKKNSDTSSITFALPESPGKFVPKTHASDEEIKTAFDITRDFLGI